MSKYFCWDPECGFETFDTIEARDKHAQKCIDDSLTDGWAESVDQICVGEITAQATKTNERVQPARADFASEEEYDDAISDWGGDTSYSSICNYEMLPIEQPPVSNSEHGS